MGVKLQHGDSLYQVIEKVNSLLDGTVKPGSASIAGSTGSGSNNALQDMIYAEQSRAEQVEQSLQEQIDILNSITGAGDYDGDEEDTEGATAETQDLQPALIIESIRAAMAEDTLQTNIDAEEIRAQTAEQQLQTNINNEVTRAQTAEQNLQDQIDAIDVSGLQQDIDDEVTRAQTAEQGLQDQIDNITAAIDGTKQTDTYTSSATGLTALQVSCHRRYGVVSITIGGAFVPNQVSDNTKVNLFTLPAKYRPPVDLYVPFTGIQGGECAQLNGQAGGSNAYGCRVIIETDGVVSFWHHMTGYLGWLSPSKTVTFPAWD